MYPLDMKLKEPLVGFALANNEDEHIALTNLGYLPAYEAKKETNETGETVESVRAKLDELGIEYDKRVGLNKLLELLPE